MTAEEPIRPAGVVVRLMSEEPNRVAIDEQLELHRLFALDWLKDRGDGRQLEACFNAPYVLSLIARIEADAATIREQAATIASEKAIADRADELWRQTEADLRAQNAAQAEEIKRITERAVQVHLELEHKHATESAELRARCERYEDLILLDEKRAEAGLAHYYRSGADGKCECVVCAEARAIRARREAQPR